MRAIHIAAKPTPRESTRTNESHEAKPWALLLWLWELPHRMSTIQYIAAATMATSAASVAAANDIWRLTAFLCIGTSVGVFWSCLSKQAKEDGRMTKARVLSGIFSGVCLPRFIELGLRWKGYEINLATVDPLVIMGVGFLFAILGFYIVHSILRRTETSEKKIGRMASNVGEKFIAHALGVSETENEQRNSPADSGPHRPD